MQKDDNVYVQHMLDLAEKAMTLVRGKDRTGYDEDETLRLALAHLVQTIGEAARRVSAEFQEKHGQIPWRDIIGIRHKVVHDYLDVDYDIVWDVVTADLPELAAALEKLLPPDATSAQ